MGYGENAISTVDKLNADVMEGISEKERVCLISGVRIRRFTLRKLLNAISGMQHADAEPDCLKCVLEDAAVHIARVAGPPVVEFKREELRAALLRPMDFQQPIMSEPSSPAPHITLALLDMLPDGFEVVIRRKDGRP